jgi:hypothetical protein
VNSWPPDTTVTVSPLAAAAFIRAKFRWNSREFTFMAANLTDNVFSVNIGAD